MLVAFGEHSITVSPLTLGAARPIRAELLAVMSLRSNADPFPTAEQADAMITVVHAAAKLVDPAVSRESIEALIDGRPFLEGIAELSRAALSVIAIQRTGAVPAAGEAASSASSSISPSSMDSSSPPLDGDSPT